MRSGRMEPEHTYSSMWQWCDGVPSSMCDNANLRPLICLLLLHQFAVLSLVMRRCDGATPSPLLWCDAFFFITQPLMCFSSSRDDNTFLSTMMRPLFSISHFLYVSSRDPIIFGQEWKYNLPSSICYRASKVAHRHNEKILVLWKAPHITHAC